ncbi:MAG: bifunctional 23S rRNA (guanine(2069)-N(7))-methyltransferase RlmK/23S rRNA (guanine(2445)-N(2))-methyltransferase RlmL [Thiohalocapsa sp.]|nr:bifunctional 23S rRNA (guanine(2069)-N(7))-methyltransferase RlmK/23S rRNA (guanine(2445)-N(2))-methyltransferase RlmL [Thiohalocapsa sp.]
MEQHTFFATAARNLETLLAEELRSLGIADARETRGGVRFSGPLADAYRVCLWSRIANRVLLPLAEFDAPHADTLYARIRDIDWSAHMDATRTLAVHMDTARSGIDHSRFGALKIKDAIVDQFREATGTRPAVDTHRPDLAIHCRLFRDRAVLSLDLSGDSLHRRGYRIEGVAAPLKETLAAAMLLRAGWPGIAAGGGSLIDPMCGSATLVIEGALMAADIAPGLMRDYWGFTGWLGHDAPAWTALLAEARERRQAGLLRLSRHGKRIRGYDSDLAAVRSSSSNVASADLLAHVQIERRELVDCRPASPAERGLVIMNPPYGERIGVEGGLPLLYANIGRMLREHFDGWHAAMLTGNPELGKRMGLRARAFHTLYNGPIECRLLHFDVAREAHVSDRPVPLPAEARGPGAEMLANRLKKNQKQLNKWLREQQISCYRLYDADLPEYALAIDVYQAREPRGESRTVAHVQEYAAPASIDPRDARRRLREALGVIADTLQIAEQDLYLKIRQPQRGKAQYERLADTGRFFEIEEDGLRLLVNFEDYLDTGLFLDHRDTRRLLRRLAPQRRFLNLFGYTGSASVHAAAGGARSTTTVDMSRTYIDWSRRNLALNGFSGRDHELIQADCLDWLTKARAYHGHFGLIFLDPPSFSTSKRMQGTFDVQRDHAALIRSAVDLLAPDGILIFSNNLRRFRLDDEALSDLDVADIGAQTIPRDFARSPQIHHCWRIERGDAVADSNEIWGRALRNRERR